MKAKEIKFRLHKWFTIEDGFEDHIVQSVNPNGSQVYKYILHAILPCKVDWCSACDGTGKRSKYDIQGYDIDAMITDEYGNTDYDFKESYFNGRTDVACDCCNGTKITNIVDEDACNEIQKAIIKEHYECIDAEIQFAEESAAERRFGA